MEFRVTHYHLEDLQKTIESADLDLRRAECEGLADDDDSIRREARDREFRYRIRSGG